MRNEDIDTPTQHFGKHGFFVARGLLTAEEVEHYKSLLKQASSLCDEEIAGGRRWAMPDGVNRLTDWWPLACHEKLLSVLRELLGPEFRFIQHTDLQINNNRAVWHRDNVARVFGQGDDWNESQNKYQVVRVGIYLQSYAESGSALGLISGSNRRESSLTRYELLFWDRVLEVFEKKEILKKMLPKPPVLVSTRPTWVRPEPGDAIIFDARMLHSPTPLRGSKYGIFLCYGVPNPHAHNHKQYYRHTRKDLGYSDLNPKFRHLLLQHKLLLE